MAATMGVIRTGNTGKHFKALKRHHIYLAKNDNLHMNETHTDTCNPIFETLYELHNSQQYALSPNHISGVQGAG
jgi:hypothetical protein